MQQARASSYKEIVDYLNTEVAWKTFPQNM